MTSSYATQATLQDLEDVTGIRHERYDCCANSYPAYTEDTDATKCPRCDADRYHPGGKTPRATFDYMPLIHRLRLQLSSARRAQILTEYLAACAKEYSEKNVLTDIWNGRLIGHLRARGLPENPGGIVFAFHTDGVKLFKTRSAFHVWPLILTIANLPPQGRFKRENIILLGIMPGSSEPTDIDSFLRPLVNELKALQHGVKQAHNTAADCFFTLHAYVVFVVADTKGRESLMGVSGTNSYRYCFYCHAWCHGMARARDTGAWVGSCLCVVVGESPKGLLCALGAHGSEGIMLLCFSSLALRPENFVSVLGTACPLCLVTM